LSTFLLKLCSCDVSWQNRRRPEDGDELICHFKLCKLSVAYPQLYHLPVWCRIIVGSM
jgi:hypothetical protein